jgi:hypothetical protein
MSFCTARRLAVSTLAILASISCGCGGSVAATNAGSRDSGTEPRDSAAEAKSVASDAQHDAIVPLVHAPMPQIPDQGGPVLTNPILVTITYPGYVFESSIKAFGDALVASNWLHTVGADYGVVAATHVHVQLTDPVPTAVTETDSQDMIAAHVADGVLPGGGDAMPPGEFIYMIFYPPGVQITSLIPSLRCAAFMDETSGAWHDAVVGASPPVVYAIIPTCSKQAVSDIEDGASHEFIEAATDTYPSTQAAYQMLASSPWSDAAEVADLCEGLQGTVEDGHTYTRVWSNTAAKAGTDSCVPAAATPYVAVSPSQDEVQMVKPGTTIDVNLVGWSSAASPPPSWSASIYAWESYATGVEGFTPTLTVKSLNFSDGQTQKLQVGIPNTAQSNQRGIVALYSGPEDNPVSMWLLAFQVE